MCACVREGQLVCSQSQQLEHSSVIIPPLSNLHTWLMYFINWIHSLALLSLFSFTHTHTGICTKALIILPHTRSFSFSPPSVFLFWRSFLCTSKSNIWVSLYLVEQDLQDIVGRMCEPEQFTLWESPIYRYTQTCINTHTHRQAVLTKCQCLHSTTASQFADIQLDFQLPHVCDKL